MPKCKKKKAPSKKAPTKKAPAEGKKNVSRKEKRVEAPYPHFRYNRKSKHPALIVGEQKSVENVEEYKYRKVMHSEKEGNRRNDKIFPNPNPKDKEPMYIARRVRHDDKNNFEPKPLSWKLPKDNKKK